MKGQSWTEGPNLPGESGKLGACSAPLDRDRAFVIGGISIGFFPIDENSYPGFIPYGYLFDLEKSAWTHMFTLPIALYQLSCAIMFDKNYTK